MSCTISTYFNKDNLDITYQVSRQLQKLVKDTLQTNNSNKSYVYDEMIKWLKGQGMFKFPTPNTRGDEGIKNLQEFIKDVLNQIKTSKEKHGKIAQANVIGKIVEQFSSVDFQIAGGVKENNVTIIEKTPEQETKGTDTLTEEEKEWLGISNIQKQVYGTSFSAKLYRQTLFERDLVKALIIDTDNRTITTDDISLNVNIGNLKERYYQQIVRFMHQVYPDNNYSDSLYVNGSLVSNYESVLSDFLAYLQKRQKENKEQFDRDINQGWRTAVTSEDFFDDIYRAANAFINLSYFDSLLSATLGKVISISPELKGQEVDINYGKYSFGTSLNNMAKGWETSENRNALEEMGKFSKLLIQSIPMYERRSGKYLHSNISIVGFINAFTNLFAAAISAQANGQKTQILTDILDTHEDPGVLIPKILKELLKSNPTINVLKQNGLNDFDINVLYSVNKYCFDGLRSIHAIENKYNVKKYTLIDCIIGVIDRVTQIDYLETLTQTNGDVDVVIKSKFHSRQQEYNLRNGINKQISNRSQNVRQELVQKYPIQQTIPGDLNSYTLKIGEDTYTITTQSKTGILGATPDDTVIRLNGKVVHFDNMANLNSSNTVAKLLQNLDLSTEETQFLNAITFIEDQTQLLKLTSQQGLDKLLISRNLTNDSVSKLLLAAVQCAIVNDLYYRYNNLEENSQTFQAFVLAEYPLLNGLSTQESNYYFSQGLGNKELTPIKISDDWVSNFALASAILSGEVSRAVTKDIFGNSIANYSTAYLGANLQYYMQKYRMSQQNASTNLFFVTRPEFIQGQVVNFDFQNRRGDKKNVKKLNTGELLYTHIIDSFWGLQGGSITSRNKKLKNKWIIQPTTYSDKTKIIEYIINPDRIIDTTENRSYKGKTLRELTSEETTQLYADTVGNYYRQIFSDQVKKYYELFPELGTYNSALTITEDQRVLYNTEVANIQVRQISEHLKKLNDYTIDQLNDLAKSNEIPNVKNLEDYLSKLAQKKGIKNFQLDTTYRINKQGKVQFNELLDYYANYLYTPEHLAKKLEKERVNFVNDLLKENVSFYTRYFDREGEVTKVSKIIEYFFTDKSTNKIDKTARDNFYKNWTKDGKLILAKVAHNIMDPEQTSFDDIIEGKSISQLLNDESIILNPLLEEYFIKDSFVANSLRLSLTGSEIAHMSKVKPEVSALTRINNPNKDYLDKINSEECAAQGAQLKRNVIIPATLQYMTQNTLIGVPPKFKVAVFRDIKAPVYNFRGDNGTVDSQDGSAKILAFTAILENNSLQDQAVGEDRKPIWHSFDPTTGTATLLKFATNTITNERMQESLGSDLNLYNLWKKMTHLRWHTDTGEVNQKWFSRQLEDIDLLSKGYKTNLGFDLQRDILQGQKLFYQEGNQIREIVGFGAEIINNKKIYYTEELPVSSQGDRLSSTPTKIYQLFDSNGNAQKLTQEQLATLDITNLHTIDSLYELHQTMGGIYSVEFNEDNTPVISESSNYAVVAFMNNVSIRTGDKTNVFRQSNYYQPLKEAMIAYAANNSAVKNGASNLNQASAWTDNSELTYMELDTDGLGIQLDPDHDIEEAHMTEFSQVIAALEAGGRLHDIADLTYQDLGRVALTTAKVELQALKHLTTDKSKSELYDVIGRTIINNLKNNRTSDLSSEILSALQGKNFNIHDNHIKDAIKIPFSDPNIYSQMLPTFVSIINSKSVKRKYPGSGCVMVPGYGTVQLYNIDGTPHQFQDVAKKALAALSKDNPRLATETFYNYQKRLVNLYLNSLQETISESSIGEFIPTDVVDVSWEQNGVKRTATIVLDSMDKYTQFKLSNFTLKTLLTQVKDKNNNTIKMQDLKNAQFTFKQNVTKPRDLAPARIWWKQDGVVHNIFDVPEIKRNFTDTLVYQTMIGRETVTRTVQVPKSWAKNVQSPNGILKYLGELAIEGSIIYTPTKSSRAEVQKVFDNLANGFVEDNGTQIQVEDLHNEAAQLVMSNLFRQRFGEKGSYVEILDKIKEGTAFKKKYIQPIRANFDYDLVLVDSSNRHGFITFADTVKTTEKSDPKLSLWDQNYIKRVPIRGEKGGISSIKGNYVYTIDKQNNLQYLIGKEVIVDLNWDDIKDSKEVAEGKYRLDANNRVVEYVEYITRYKAFDRKKRGSTNHYVYQIRVNNLKQNNDYQLLPKLVSTLYNQGNYNELRLSTKIPIETVSTIQDALPNENNTLYSFETSRYLSQVKKYLVTQAINKLNNVDKKPENILIDWKQYQGMIKQYYDTKAKITQTSFLRSLEVTASRIPAQTLQSFMQMQTAGFTNSSKNMCYVSHFQTYLQGSDYDIDKAYIMMSEIDQNGQYVGWSPLFNYSSLEFLKASELLPTPAGNTFVFDSNSAVDISNDLKNIKDSEGATKLIAEASLIQKLDKLAQLQNVSTFGVTLNLNIFTPEEKEQFTDIAKRKKANKILRDQNKQISVEAQNELLPTIQISQEELLKVATERSLYRLNLHENYEIPLESREAAYKNSVSSKINRIIQDLRNMDSAYSSVDEEMDTLRGIADNSPKGNLTKQMSLTNPATKFQMQVQNMVGKDVIGISATGEKIFFNLSYYWNEGIRSGNEEWLRNLQFQHTFDRIQNRNSGNPISRTVDTVANLNMDIPNPETLVNKFNEISDIIKSTETLFRSQGKFISRTSEEFQNAVRQEIRNRHANVSQADIQISALLSAATDNAKELILARINADSNLAGNYLYLMSIGFSIDDIAAFMISPAVTVVSSFINDNMFDAYSLKLTTVQVTNLLLGIIPYKVILTGKVKYKDSEDPERDRYYPMTSVVTDAIAEQIGLDMEQFTNNDVLPEYIRKRLTGQETKSIRDIVGTLSTKKDYQVTIFSNYIDNIIEKIQVEFSKSNKPIEEQWEDFRQDLQEFRTVQSQAQEATSLGQTFLSLNQGLPTSEEDLLKKLKQMQNIVTKRENDLRVSLDNSSISLDVAISRYKEADDPEKKEKYYKSIITTLKNNNPKLEESYIEEVLEKSLDIAGNFNIRKWLNNFEYRKQVKDYYNIIKATWNIFDVIERIPHYNALMQLFTAVYNINLNISLKSKIIDNIHDSFISNGVELDDYMLKQLTHYVDDRLITSWINQSSSTNFVFPIEAGNTYLDADFNEVTTNTDIKLDLKTPIGIRNFKYFMEKYLIPQLQSRILDTIYGNINVKTNPFIQNLVLTEDNRGIPFYKLDIDMMTIDRSPENQYKFQNFIDGLMELKGINYQGHPLSDWFIMYNFIVNKNNYGQDRMTTIFKPFLQLSTENNLLREYYKYISEIDYQESEVNLKDLGIYLEDAKMYIAPYKTVYQEASAKDPYIKQSINGFTIYKKRSFDNESGQLYQEIQLIPKRTLVNKNQTEIEQMRRLRNQMQYGVLESPVVNSVEYYKMGLDSNDIDTITDILAVLASKGNLLYVIENCD